MLTLMNSADLSLSVESIRCCHNSKQQASNKWAFTCILQVRQLCGPFSKLQCFTTLQANIVQFRVDWLLSFEIPPIDLNIDILYPCISKVWATYRFWQTWDALLCSDLELAVKIQNVVWLLWKWFFCHACTNIRKCRAEKWFSE